MAGLRRPGWMRREWRWWRLCRGLPACSGPPLSGPVEALRIAVMLPEHRQPDLGVVADLAADAVEQPGALLRAGQDGEDVRHPAEIQPADHRRVVLDHQEGLVLRADHLADDADLLLVEAVGPVDLMGRPV